MNERDAEVLRWVGEMYSVNLDTLAILLGRSQYNTNKAKLADPTVRQIVQRWLDSKLITKSKFGADTWITLNQSGLIFTGLETFKARRFNAQLSNHNHQVALTRLYFEAKFAKEERLAGWIPERQLRQEIKSGHVPDGKVWLEKDDHSITTMPVEIELSQKCRGKFHSDVLSSQYDEFLYYVDPAKSLRRVITEDVAAYNACNSLQKKVTIFDLPTLQKVEDMTFGKQLAPWEEGASDV